MSDQTQASVLSEQQYSAIMSFDVWRLLELLAVLVLTVSIVGLVAMRLGAFHAWQIWIIGLLGTYVYARTCANRSMDEVRSPVWHVVLIIGVALLFRLPVFNYQLGGQDEGVYTNMAAHLVHTGEMQPVDALLQEVVNPQLRDQYIQENYHSKHYLPGIYALGDGKLEFQFYHLFPVWLAMFGGILGLDHVAYALTLFSLLSLLFMQRLAALMTGNAVAGLAAGLLLALNPLHAFFSKFPVTEVPTLAFSLMAFTFLLVAWRNPRAYQAGRYVVISLAAFAMLFMTRISGFMYLPLIMAILAIGLLSNHEPGQRRRLVSWSLWAILLYAASIAYGLRWSHIYSADIYMASFQPVLGDHWLLALSFAISMAVVGFGILWYAVRRESGRGILRRAVEKGALVLPILILLFTVLAAWKAYKLGYTDAYLQHPWYGEYFKLAGAEIKAVRSTSLFVSTIYLSPFLFIALWFLSAQLERPAIVSLLLLFVVSFYGYLAVLQWILPYQPYYARYLVSEFVPYVILFVVCARFYAERGFVRSFASFAILAGGIWCTVLSAHQVGKSEHEGVGPSLQRLVSHFDGGDVVFLDSSLVEPIAHEIKTALVFMYGLNVVTVDRMDEREEYVRRLALPYNDVFYVSQSTLPPRGFVEVDSVDFNEMVFCHGVSPPTDVCVRSNSELMVYRRPRAGGPSAGEVALEFSVADTAIKTIVGRKEGGVLVGDGRAGFVMFGPYRPLAAGQYSAIIYGTSSKPFTLDLGGEQGKRVIYRHAYPAAQDPAAGLLTEFQFELSESVRDLEVRIHVDNESDIRIEGYRVSRR